MNTTVNKQAKTTPGQFHLHRRIGSTTYKVGIHYNPNAKETLDDKIRRLLNFDLQAMPDNATMDSLQAGWLSERKAI